MGALPSGLEIVRRHRMEGAFSLVAAVALGALCVAFPSNGWMYASVAVLCVTAAIDLLIARWLATASETDTLRREGQAMRWSLVWYVLPMVSAPLLFVEGVSQQLGEHAPVPIVAAVVSLGAGTAVLQGLFARQLTRSVARADTKPTRRV